MRFMKLPMSPKSMNKLSNDSENLTTLIKKWQQGDEEAFNDICRNAMPVLLKMAKRHSQQGVIGEQTLVQVFLMTIRDVKLRNDSTQGFYGLASKVLRHILINELMRQRTEKRGGGVSIEPIDEHDTSSESNSDQILMIDKALKILYLESPEWAQVFEMFHYGGCSAEEIREDLGISIATVYLRKSKAKDRLKEILSK